ncbi:DUF3572 domain-containing protein [Bartonella sp. HY761]|uniref:DUF3572 domain-containing protein n=1 Tax=Bartonella sp. HY761 TaxID=2979330 RepID=UPI0021FE6F89|nr:DUF3572 domain-containing protein [Bartonella sp. HY761]UXN05301.1 DUF3572 domain-containing protein [Bartonella sp. HY761]
MKHSVNHEQAETIAITALGFLAGDQELLERFMAISGIAGQDIRQAASSPGFLAGVLSFLLNHEPSLLMFCQSSNIQPERVAEAFAALPGGSPIEF